MEQHLVQSFGADAPLSDFFLPRDAVLDWFYPVHSLGVGIVPANPDKPFIIWNELPSIPYRAVEETSNCEARTFLFFVHDEIGDFTRINAILRELRRIVKGMAPFTVDIDGVTYRCSESKWLGISSPIPDPQYDTSVRYGTARFTVSS